MSKIALIGDVILDKYDYCSNRENPESSAPCYNVERTEYKPGGAGNVAANLSALGADFELMSVIGNDGNAKILGTVLFNSNIPCNLIIDDNRETIVKERTLSIHDGRYHFRKDRERKQYIDENHTSEILKHLSDTELIVISDYNKGVISERLIERLKQTGKKIIADFKPAHKDFYHDIFMIVPNMKEARQMSGLENEIKAAEKLRKELGTRVLLKRSEKGISYFGLKGDSKLRVDFPAEAKKVFDVTGAGDSVLAAFSHFYIKGLNLEDCIKFANKSAGIAVSYPGCYAVSEKEIFENY
ncbi:MAG: PfkB family carbohydrate kinase [Candidatus Pacearchaeota archaeon]